MLTLIMTNDDNEPGAHKAGVLCVFFLAASVAVLVVH
jgi:hypothetical protein